MTAYTRKATPSANRLSYDVTSESDPSKLYLVVFDKSTGDWTCDCPDFRFRSDGDGYKCKHVEIAQDRFLADQADRFAAKADKVELADRVSVLIGTYPVEIAKLYAAWLREGAADGVKIVLRGRTPIAGHVWGARVSLPLDLSRNAAIYIVKG